MFYDESVLLTLTLVVCTPIKVDTNTMNRAQGRFAIMCVEIDLTKPMKERLGYKGIGIMFGIKAYT